MSVLDKLASALNRSDEAPNQLLARELAERRDEAGVHELVLNLNNPDKAIQSDCIKVLYEVGALDPGLIAPYVSNFIALLGSRNNRLVWGGMTALGAVAALKAADIWKQIDTIIYATDRGSAITQDWGVRVLATVSAQDSAYEAKIFPFLKAFLQRCPPQDLPRHAESCLIALNAANRDAVLVILEQRSSSLKPAQAKRLQQVIRRIKSL